jgi:prepilin-type N-terminal cleavage/methylation domain-containing protein
MPKAEVGQTIGFGRLSVFRALARHDRPRKAMVRPTAGVTLIEMLVVVAVIGIIVGVSAPSVSAGLDSVRLASTGDAIASFLNGAVTHAERSEQPVEVVISLTDGTISADGADGFARRFHVPQGITMDKVLPELGEFESGNRQILIVPGGTAPAIGVEYSNRHGGRRRVELDPMTGFPRVETVNTK